MLRNNDVAPVEVIPVGNQRGKSVILQSQAVPVYDLKATAGIVELIRDNNSGTHIPIDYLYVPYLPKCDGALTVRGDSMYPLLKSGDMVLYKEVKNYNNIIWGEMYLIAINNDGDEFFFAKYLQKGSTAEHIKLVSRNEHHQEKEFPIRSITALALVKATIRINTQS
ncbi:S24 family peptidase [Pedobacter paludis]|uniref:Peptidase S24/S26A/S26B/S26C domain-containing protein n=1 Tax=Pedobacter paludis TaxID=2203212 RepID=A0A317F0F5_9SPHI|nr:S24 family peptidase [Pedobacter paludis]PWS32245.1 hypothetical protein DF947_10785 [Pedobacter paludis]